MATGLSKSLLIGRVINKYLEIGQLKGTCKLTARFIMTSPARAKKLLESLKENPYFDKYSAAITKLQQTNPDEFVSRFDAKEKQEEKKKAIFCKRYPTNFINGSLTRHFGDYKPKNVYITTPIFYVNAGPHIGHLYTAVLADAISRYNVMLGNEVRFTTGTDEHGNKVKNAAQVNKLAPEIYCDKISHDFKNMCDTFDVKYTDFVRTTETRHQDTVHQFWNLLKNAGHIYMGKYSGWYCLSDEAFISKSELAEKKDQSGKIVNISSTSGNLVEWMEEDNYKFRLSSFQNDLKHWLKNENSVKPLKYHKILSSWVEDGEFLQDLSVSRPISRAPWGIKVPDNDSHTIYVWLDALVNYLTSLGYPTDDKFSQFWPPTCQVIGKDILKFHGVYWPAFLIAAGLDPPQSLLCHSHWTVCDEKMSKSKGNVVSPFEASKTFTTDGLRYFLLREAVPHSDANYSEVKVRRILNSELADTLGNLVSRCMGKAINPSGVIPEPTADHVQLINTDQAVKLVESVKSLPLSVKQSYDDLNFHHVVDLTMKCLFIANKLIEEEKPWVLVKQAHENKDSAVKLEAVLALCLETTRICALILSPIIPTLSSTLLTSLNVPMSARTWDNTQYLNTGRQHLNTANKFNIFFKRIK